jgi:hypothetical protein
MWTGRDFRTNRPVLSIFGFPGESDRVLTQQTKSARYDKMKKYCQVCISCALKLGFIEQVVKDDKVEVRPVALGDKLLDIIAELMEQVNQSHQT